MRVRLVDRHLPPHEAEAWIDTPLSGPELRLATLYLQHLEMELLLRTFAAGVLPAGFAQVLVQFWGGQVVPVPQGEDAGAHDHLELSGHWEEQRSFLDTTFGPGATLPGQMERHGLGRDGVGLALLCSEHLDLWDQDRPKLPQVRQELTRRGDTFRRWEQEWNATPTQEDPK